MPAHESAPKQDIVFMLVDLATEDDRLGTDTRESIDDYLHEHMDDLFLASYSDAFSGDSFERPTQELTTAETATFFRDIGSAHASARAEREAPGYDSRWAAVWSMVDAIVSRDLPAVGG